MWHCLIYISLCKTWYLGGKRVGGMGRRSMRPVRVLDQAGTKLISKRANKETGLICVKCMLCATLCHVFYIFYLNT